jgi:hypothetical protein
MTLLLINSNIYIVLFLDAFNSSGYVAPNDEWRLLQSGTGAGLLRALRFPLSILILCMYVCM